MTRDIQCAYVAPPRCPNPVKGKGLYCPIHQPSPGDINKSMTQSQVINHFVNQTGLRRAQVREMFAELSSLAADQVKSNGEFVLPGFGRLLITERRARQGRNPATGESIRIPAKTTLKFRVGKGMRDSVLPKK
jgi:DNA-binding protein HU-beta